MTEKPPIRRPPVPDSEAGNGPGSLGDEPEGELTEENEISPDPYDDLWDPDMDTRPERIKRTKARPKMEPRGRGRPTSRGKRKEDT